MPTNHVRVTHRKVNTRASPTRHVSQRTRVFAGDVPYLNASVVTSCGDLVGGASEAQGIDANFVVD